MTFVPPSSLPRWIRLTWLSGITLNLFLRVGTLVWAVCVDEYEVAVQSIKDVLTNILTFGILYRCAYRRRGLIWLGIYIYCMAFGGSVLGNLIYSALMRNGVEVLGFSVFWVMLWGLLDCGVMLMLSVCLWRANRRDNVVLPEDPELMADLQVLETITDAAMLKQVATRLMNSWPKYRAGVKHRCKKRLAQIEAMPRQDPVPE